MDQVPGEEEWIRHITSPNLIIYCIYEYEINITQQSDKLASATPEQRANFIVSASGYGIHWPELDEDLAVDGLIGVKHPCPVVGARTSTDR